MQMNISDHAPVSKSSLGDEWEQLRKDTIHFGATVVRPYQQEIRDTETIPPALLAGLAFALIWSLSFVFTKSALCAVPPLWLAALRLILAGGVLMACRARPVVAFLRGLRGVRLVRVVLAGLLSQAVYLGASYWALGHLPTSIVNIVVSSLPLATLPVAYSVLGEDIGPGDILAFALSMFGVWITLDNSAILSGFNGQTRLAALVLVGSVLALALGNVLNKVDVSGDTLIPLCAVQFLLSGAGLLGLCLYLDPDFVPHWPAILEALPALGFLSLIGSILGTLLWFQVLVRLSANAASSFFLFTPVMGVALGALVLDEPVTLAKVTGILILSLAIALRLKKISLAGAQSSSVKTGRIG